jgi:hypothetical protein
MPLLAIILVDLFPFSIISLSCLNLLFTLMFFYYIKLNPNQHGFIKSRSPVINLVTFVDFTTPVVRGRRQADAAYFGLSNAFNLVPHNMLLHQLCSLGISDGYVSCFRN